MSTTLLRADGPGFSVAWHINDTVIWRRPDAIEQAAEILSPYLDSTRTLDERLTILAACQSVFGRFFTDEMLNIALAVQR